MSNFKQIGKTPEVPLFSMISGLLLSGVERTEALAKVIISR
jgi:hypothetical protein